MQFFKKYYSFIRDYLLIIIGCALIAIAMDLFLVPNKIASGGATGFATVIFHLTNGKVPVGAVIIAFNIPLFLIGTSVMGKEFLIKSAISTLLLSVMIDLFKPLAAIFIKSYFEDIGGGNTDLMLFCIFGGVIMGIGIGLVFRTGGTTGGTDIAAALLQKIFPTATIGQMLLLIDGVVVIFAGIVFNSFLLAMYAIVVIYITTKIIDAILEGVNFAKSVYVISDYSEEIAELIMKNLGRGVTALNGIGMYTKREKNVLFCVIERAEIPKLKAIVKEHDPDAFIVMGDVREVLGDFGRGRR